MVSFYWYDYETFGTSPAFDRPAQFAGIRTDDRFNIIGDPLVVYCRQADDYLPAPEACLVTGITPQLCNQRGLPEYQFIQRIHKELSFPGTCNIGYNNIRFDDEFTRHILFRNFFDAYQHEWKDGNSRWDLLDIVRMTRALRPEDIQWPSHADGSPSNRLEDITRVNDITHSSAHDALSDVEATISVAKLLRERKPRLFDYAFKHRGKQQVFELLNLRDSKPVVHVSGMIPGEYLHTALVLPLARHPGNANGILVYDLRYDPREFLKLPGEELALRLFSPKQELPPDMPRLPVKTIHANRCPVLAPLGTLDEAARERTAVDLDASLKHAAMLASQPDFIRELQSAFREQAFSEPVDIDASLYSGGFFTQSDKRQFQRLHNLTPQQLSDCELFFDDQRIPEMLFRFQARNFPESLNSDQLKQWEQFRRERFPASALETYRQNLLRLLTQATPEQQSVLSAVQEYMKDVVAGLPATST